MRPGRQKRGSGIRALILCACALSANGQQFDARIGVRPKDRANAIDESRRVSLPTRTSFHQGMDQGAVPPTYPMEHLVLVLKSDPDQSAALEQLGTAQQDHRSPLYRHWLTPDAFGAHFGVSEHDIAAVTGWLHSYGFDVDPPPKSRRWLVFSGTAAQVEAAFHTSIHTYLVNGAIHHANATAPEIPEALAGVVDGPLSLSDARAAAGPQPKLLLNGSLLTAPYDFAAIYDTIPLYSAGGLAGGLGESIAIVGRSNVNPGDMNAIQINSSTFGMATLTVLTPYGDPGINCLQGNPNFQLDGCVDWLEATLDVTRAASVAPQAQVILVPAKSTNTTDGIILSAQYIVDNNVAPIMSLSFSDCEPAMSHSDVTMWTNLWSQAVAQGMSVFVASGDWGADACYPQRGDGSVSFKGPAVNGLCSSPNVVCVGGTMFDDAPTSSYWSAGNALGYIPENVWDEAEGSVIYGTGGGPSTLYPKPAWQQAVTPADGARDIPDVSLSSAFHDPYLLYLGGKQTTGQGTSASAPSFAGIMALLLSSTGSDLPWGNPAPTLYQLQAGAAPSPFHTTIGGDNSVPGVPGYSAHAFTPYNLATGLGSVDVAALAGVWPSTTLGVAVSHQGSFFPGETGATYTVTVSTTARPSTGQITVTDSLPAGLTMTSMTGAGWSCSFTDTAGTCTRSDVLAPNANYPITVTVNVAVDAASSVTNQVSVVGGGSLGATAADIAPIHLHPQTITFVTLPTQRFGIAPFPVTATASSGLTVSFASTTLGVCQVSGATISLVALGICTVRATQPGNASYAAASAVNRSFLVVSVCDLTMAGSTDVSDVQQIVNEAMGLASPATILSGSGAVTVVDVEIEINAALGKGCSVN